MNNQIMKWSLEQLQHIYNELKDEKEIDIIKRYGNNAKRFTAIVILFHINNLVLVFFMPFALYAFNGILNKQDIKRVIQAIIPKHFVGREHYFYLIYLHMGIALTVGGTAIVATGMMIIAYIIHACGIFRIASYRIEKAIAINTLNNVNLQNEITMYKQIIHAVNIHRKAIK
ncbi:uncharacterized protein LOC105424453 [Pogonomyrmex barbatus]|uniref:Uncharacterized protein LOC105424453 n=1 Tax=Pogonomyrmex barbatus TaxID=144034 RepID=A0A8N1S5X1_9HYME|nr:uncharacterized protein LOC105424453 [Pogonomyrmex barbatus]